VLVLNGSLGGACGNTSAVLQSLQTSLEKRASVEVVHLASDVRTPEQLRERMLMAGAFVFATGTYWDSWGSPMQRFLEQSTELEASDVWLGKPAAVVVTMHSVGGKGVLSRLQGVLTTLGCSIPPMTGFVYSLAAHLAMREAPNSAHLGDFWQLADLETVAHNLLEAASHRANYDTWVVDRRNPHRLWISPGNAIT